MQVSMIKYQTTLYEAGAQPREWAWFPLAGCDKMGFEDKNFLLIL
jgi:hypothetical protein